MSRLLAIENLKLLGACARSAIHVVDDVDCKVVRASSEAEFEIKRRDTGTRIPFSDCPGIHRCGPGHQGSPRHEGIVVRVIALEVIRIGRVLRFRSHNAGRALNKVCIRVDAGWMGSRVARGLRVDALWTKRSVARERVAGLITTFRIWENIPLSSIGKRAARRWRAKIPGPLPIALRGRIRAQEGDGVRGHGTDESHRRRS